MGFWEQVIKNKTRYVINAEIIEGQQNDKILFLLQRASISYNKEFLYIYDASNELIINRAPFINNLPNGYYVYMIEDGTIVTISPEGENGSIQIDDMKIALRLTSKKT